MISVFGCFLHFTKFAVLSPHLCSDTFPCAWCQTKALVHRVLWKRREGWLPEVAKVPKESWWRDFPAEIRGLEVDCQGRSQDATATRLTFGSTRRNRCFHPDTQKQHCGGLRDASRHLPTCPGNPAASGHLWSRDHHVDGAD